jgi:proteic killer suppression protein
VNIRTFRHKGLRQFYEEGVTRGIPAASVDKIRKMLGFLESIAGIDELKSLSSWKAHILVGERKGTWSLSVTANQRLTFVVDPVGREIQDVNLEDYH